MPKKIISETRLYPIIIHRDGNLWGYSSPEFGGGGGASFSDAFKSAQEMLGIAVADWIDEHGNAPKPSAPETVEADGGQIAWLPVTARNAAERIFLTLPKVLLAQIDAKTKNLSAFCAELARERLAR